MEAKMGREVMHMPRDTCQYLKGGQQEDGIRVLARVHSQGTRSGH